MARPAWAPARFDQRAAERGSRIATPVGLDASRGQRLLRPRALPEGQRLPGSEILLASDVQRGSAIGAGGGAGTRDVGLGRAAESRELLFDPGEVVAPGAKKLPIAL